MTNSAWEDLYQVIGWEILPVRLSDLPPAATNGLAMVIERDGLHGTRSGSGEYYFEPFEPDYMEVENLGETAVVQYLDLCVRAFLKQILGLDSDPAPFLFQKQAFHTLFKEP